MLTILLATPSPSARPHLRNSTFGKRRRRSTSNALHASRFDGNRSRREYYRDVSDVYTGSWPSRKSSANSASTWRTLTSTCQYPPATRHTSTTDNHTVTTSSRSPRLQVKASRSKRVTSAMEERQRRLAHGSCAAGKHDHNHAQ
jgi:hypothetical protein